MLEPLSAALLQANFEVGIRSDNFICTSSHMSFETKEDMVERTASSVMARTRTRAAASLLQFSVPRSRRQNQELDLL